MSRTEQKRFEALLESKQAELAGRLGNRDGIAIEKTADPLDAVQSAGERELAIRNLRLQSNLARKVRSALIRIARGTLWLLPALRSRDKREAPRHKAAIQGEPPWMRLRR